MKSVVKDLVIWMVNHCLSKIGKLFLRDYLETADMAGLDLTLAIHEYIFKYLDNAKEPSPLLREKVKKGDLGFKTGRGFKEWSPQKTRETRTKLIEYLLHATKSNF